MNMTNCVPNISWMSATPRAESDHRHLRQKCKKIIYLSSTYSQVMLTKFILIFPYRVISVCHQYKSNTVKKHCQVEIKKRGFLALNVKLWRKKSYTRFPIPHRVCFLHTVIKSIFVVDFFLLQRILC